ncbi:MAG TPA: methyltransferase domain-containing protein [Myxococcales bacterium LLY-WYZ-16_1]|nr:methyltransferase domain-containing protein [Myxococcales bacterium LLY-WYZ-16_1]
MDRLADRYFGGGDGFVDRALRDRVDWMVAWARGPRVLDTGCSQGLITELLRQKGMDALGHDLDPQVIAEARQRFPQARFTSDAAALGSNWDTVVAGEVIEHVEDPLAFFREMRALLGPEGRLVLTTPHGHHPHPDHRHTFSLAAFTDLIPEDLTILHLRTVDGFIRFAGTPGVRTVEYTRELMEMAESDLIEGQQRFEKRRMGMERRYNNQLRQTQRLQAELDDLTQRRSHRLVVQLREVYRRIRRLG